MTRLDMSEYSEKFAVTRLVGAPPGYVGYDEGGQLTEAVRRKPYSVVLFDEFEKAHREVATLLLQVMDEGHLTDSHGQKVDFRSSLLVLTSNLGAQALADLAEGRSSEEARPQVLEAVSQALPPEFVNRLDQIVLFNRLPRSEIAKIAEIELAKVRTRLAEKRLTLHVSADAVQWLAEAGYDPAYGGAPRRARGAPEPAQPNGEGTHWLRRQRSRGHAPPRRHGARRGATVHVGGLEQQLGAQLHWHWCGRAGASARDGTHSHSAGARGGARTGISWSNLAAGCGHGVVVL